MRAKLIFGTVFIAAAVATHHYTEPWLRTPRDPRRPVSLVPGHVSSEFVARYSARYRLGLDFDAPEQLPFRKPNCVTAPHYPPGECDGIPSQLKVTWVLSSGGQVLRHGSAAPIIWNLSGGPFLDFVQFHLESARRYQLDVDFLNDGSQYASAQPRLCVGVFQPEFGDTFGLGLKLQLLELSARAGYLLCAAIGLALIGTAFFRRRAPDA